MAVTFVQVFLALFFTHACMCTKQDLNSGRLVVGVVRQSNLKEKPKDSAKLAAEDLSGDRKKRSLSPRDRLDSVREVNNLRRAVGASNMPYMTYSTVQETEAALWTGDCNVHKPVIVTRKAYYLKYATTGLSVPSLLVEGFRSSYSRQFNSVYLRRFGCDQRKCGSVTFEGRNYTDLTLCLFEAETNFNENLTQYTIGEACTTCLSGSYWCYEGLCRDDCSSQISTCSCFSSCPKCQSWDRGSCTCPSQPNTNAASLECHNKGEMAFRADTSLVIIVLSTLVLFGLQ